MKKWTSHLKTILIFLAVWLILHESVHWMTVLQGLIFSTITLMITNTFLLRGDYARFYRLNPSVLFRYALTVMAQIFLSGFKAIPRILGGKGEVAFDEYQSVLDQDLTLALLATAVTLTPGTVTVSLLDRKLLILHFQEAPRISKPISEEWQPTVIESILKGTKT